MIKVNDKTKQLLKIQTSPIIDASEFYSNLSTNTVLITEIYSSKGNRLNGKNLKNIIAKTKMENIDYKFYRFYNNIKTNVYLDEVIEEEIEDNVEEIL